MDEHTELRKIVIGFLRNMGSGGQSFDQISNAEIAEHLEANRQSWWRFCKWHEAEKAKAEKLTDGLTIIANGGESAKSIAKLTLREASQDHTKITAPLGA